MSNWRLAKSLEKLRIQINAAHPSRSKASDGSIGNAEHAARASDHNPNAQGVVTAIDITVDLANGVDGHELSRTLAQDGRTKYVIYSGEIYRSYKPNLGWAKYTGSNPHNKHVHISVLANKADDDEPWANIGEPKPRAVKRSTLRRGDTGSAVQDLQRALGFLGSDIDGNFGMYTELAVREFQAHHGLKVDGIVGRATNQKLFNSETEVQGG